VILFAERLLRRVRLGEPVIVVSGLPRSGTSMMMKMLAAGGLEVATDAVRAADEDNPKGYFELERVKQLEQDPDKRWVRECRGRVVKVISYLLKELPDDNAYRVVFMHRALEEVVASQNTMLDRRGEERGADDSRMIQVYGAHLRRVEVLLAEAPNFEVLGVPYRDALERPREQAVRVAGFLGRRLDLDRMVEVADPALYRNRIRGAPGERAS
jgi:hypothetical protein